MGGRDLMAGVATMTSLELVDFINVDRREQAEAGVRKNYIELAHRSFMSKAPEVLGNGCAKFLADYRHPQNGQVYSIYKFPKREACLMAMSYSYELQAKVFDRMTELEAAAPAQVKLSRLDLLELALTSERERIALAAQVAEQAPKVAFVDSYVTSSTGSKGFREVCKLLKANESEFREFLLDKKIMYRLSGAWTPHAAHLDVGRFEVKTGTSGDHVFNQAKFTAKGIDWVAGEWAKHQISNRDGSDA